MFSYTKPFFSGRPLVDTGSAAENPRALDEPLTRETPPTVDEIADPERLIRTYYKLKANGGQAPGPDGIRFEDLSRREVAEIMRSASPIIKSGNYIPSTARRVAIPKPADGVRTLSIRNMICRVVEKSLNDALTPYWEGKFLDCSYGFRPATGTWDLLLDMERRIASDGLYYFVQDDIRKAFDNVNVEQVMDAHRAYIDDPRLLALINAVVRGNRRRVEGLETGSPYSPTALNVLLHHKLDTPYANHFSFPLYRYVDNLAHIGSGITQCEDALEAVRTLLLDLGLTLKGDSEGVVDLRQTSVDLLGYRLKWDGKGLPFSLAASAWESLCQALIKAYTAEDPLLVARGVVRGWLYAAAPALEGLVDQVVNRLVGLLCRNGFDIGDQELHLWVQEAIEAWGRFRNGTLSRRCDAPAAPPAGTHVFED